MLKHLSSCAWLGSTLALVAPACSSEPCAYSETVDVAPQTTPFPGRTVFSICDRCPVLTEPESLRGPATGCAVRFHEDWDRAFVDCLYGPGATGGSSIANDAVTDVPSNFAFCEDRCPNPDVLHACDLTATASGVREMSCSYGQSC